MTILEIIDFSITAPEGDKDCEMTVTCVLEDGCDNGRDTMDPAYESWPVDVTSTFDISQAEAAEICMKPEPVRNMYVLDFVNEFANYLCWENV